MDGIEDPQEDYFKRLYNPNMHPSFSTEDTKTTFYWCSRDGSTAQMVMFWLRENWMQDVGSGPTATYTWITRHSFTFRRIPLGGPACSQSKILGGNQAGSCAGFRDGLPQTPWKEVPYPKLQCRCFAIHCEFSIKHL